MKPPLIAHFIHSLRMGGMESVLVTLINNLPSDIFRHMVICMTDYDDTFRNRITSDEVEVLQLHKRKGNDPGCLKRLYDLLRSSRPAIFHTRNLGTLEGQWVAALAGVAGRVHGEHGRDIYDLDGTNLKYNLFRRATRPLIHQYTAVSRDLADWLTTTVHVPPTRVRQIYNGVDTDRFRPGAIRQELGAPQGFLTEKSFVIGTVGRLVAVKDQTSLVEAFGIARNRSPRASSLRLVIVGEGGERDRLERLVQSLHLQDSVWLTGNRTDTHELMRLMRVFCLPSLAEGISNTILEAMATGLPVVGTSVGGTPELVRTGETGFLVPVSNPQALAEGIERYLADEKLRVNHATQARQVAVERFSLEAMLNGYCEMYEQLLKRPN